MAGTSLHLYPVICSLHSPIQTQPIRFISISGPWIRNRKPLRPKHNSRQAIKPESESQTQNPNLIPGLLNRIGFDDISLEIVYIALPAFLSLAADPIASLVDTAFVGHLGSIELAAIGVSVSLFNLISKLFNIPLLNITASFVAEQQVLDSKTTGSKGYGSALLGGRKNLPAVSTSLALAAGFGILEAITLSLGSGPLLNFMGIPVLNDKVALVPPNLIGSGITRYLKSGGLLIGRTVAVLLTMTLGTSLAAREGPVPMAGHQICLQVWLAMSLLNDALALAGQALLASEYTKGNYKQARLIVYRVLQGGAAIGILLATLLFFEFETFSTIFTTDKAILDVTRSGVLFVAASQPVNAIAFVLDGLYYGVSDFAFAAYSMVLVGLVSSVFLVVVSPVFGLIGVWTGLFLFMTLRAAAGFWRLGTKGGPWKMVFSNEELEMMGE